MAIFAVIDKDNKVINRIEAEELETALDVTKQNCIPCDGTSVIGGTWNGTVFIAPQPYPSWTLVNNVWTPPVVRPAPDGTTDYSWDEASQKWDAFTIPDEVAKTLGLGSTPTPVETPVTPTPVETPVTPTA